MKRLLPIRWYRCHDCGWRRGKIRGGLKGIFLHSLSLMGYAGSVALVIALAAGLILITLSFLGIPMPW